MLFTVCLVALKKRVIKMDKLEEVNINEKNMFDQQVGILKDLLRLSNQMKTIYNMISELNRRLNSIEATVHEMYINVPRRGEII